MKVILGAMAAVALFVGVAATQPAEARCWWNGYVTECWHHPHPYWGWGWHRHYYPW
jgi:cyclic lactone autoinducer peptide